MDTQVPSNLEVFISYSHCDVDWLKSLKVVLKPLERESQLISWCDRQIEAGEDIDKKALDHLDTAKIILLLVSPDFLASDYCYSIEMKGAMEKHAKGAARVIPVILRHCDWKGTDVGRLKAVPKDGKPVSTWADRDEAFMDIINELRRSLSSISTATELEMTSHSARTLAMVESRGVLGHKALPEGQDPLRFSAVSDPVRIRNEGMTELVGDIFIQCTYDGTTIPQQPLGFGLKISFGTNVTSRSYSSRSGSRPVIGGDPVLFEVGRPSAPAFITCSKVEAFVGHESSVKTTASVIIDGVVVQELSLQDGLAMAVWEVDGMPDRGWLAGEAYSEFAIFCGCDGPLLPGTGKVGGSLAPSPSPSHFTASAGTTSNDVLPLPRFMDTSTAHPLLRVL